MKNRNLSNFFLASGAVCMIVGCIGLAISIFSPIKIYVKPPIEYKVLGIRYEKVETPEDTITPTDPDITVHSSAATEDIEEEVPMTDYSENDSDPSYLLDNR